MLEHLFTTIIYADTWLIIFCPEVVIRYILKYSQGLCLYVYVNLLKMKNSLFSQKPFNLEFSNFKDHTLEILQSQVIFLVFFLPLTGPIQLSYLPFLLCQLLILDICKLLLDVIISNITRTRKIQLNLCHQFI